MAGQKTTRRQKDISRLLREKKYNQPIEFINQKAYSNAGMGLELEAIGATVIGGTFLFGGSGTIIGTVMGTFIIFSVENILILSRAPAFWFRSFVGVIVILAVSVHILIQGKKEH